ncbi:S-adenosyl-L-methionine-dependent methyltransferase [Mycena sp. CBHHK59/15]|nr:S-adenosyl-L-methionine-dependent methyltransferase [Mycena sp. CBHHK59/15]
MATFAKSTYNSAIYAAFRPTYPRRLFDAVMQFHAANSKPGWDRAVDLGCGTGQATVELLHDGKRLGFQSVMGVDPSANMVQIAKESVPEQFKLGVEFRQSSAEDLSFIQDGTVDLVTAAQAAHWFDWGRLWPELHRILKPGGTVAFWGYSELRLTKHPELTPLITEYSQGTDPATSLGPHWEPGRKIVDNHLLAIGPSAELGWTDLTRVFYTGRHHPALPAPPHEETILKKTMPWGPTGFAGYLRTFSSLHRYHEAFPEDLTRGDGDIATRFLKQLMKGAGLPEGEEAEKELVEVEWPLALVMVRKA